MQPAERRGDTVPIDKKTSKQKATEDGISVNLICQKRITTHLNNMTSVPTRLATLTLANAIESQRTTLAVVRLKRTRVSMNFQKPATVGTRPTRP